ncbi:MAG TPA: PASTA domain-containing protein, partial [Thermodesulfovibrionia bacterium]|nr:PASTA domain-containing protein [Thermodesulfovibrionia bacterium]
MFKSFFKILFYFLVFIAIGAVAALVIFNIIDFKKTVNVPSLTGKDVPAASELLNNKGLSLEVQGEEYNEKIPAGFISRQDVIEGEKVKKGSSIKVFVSKGGEMFTIP